MRCGKGIRDFVPIAYSLRARAKKDVKIGKGFPENLKESGLL
jgi:hypothetical protein